MVQLDYEWIIILSFWSFNSIYFIFVLFYDFWMKEILYWSLTFLFYGLNSFSLKSPYKSPFFCTGFLDLSEKISNSWLFGYMLHGLAKLVSLGLMLLLSTWDCWIKNLEIFFLGLFYGVINWFLFIIFWLIFFLFISPFMLSI